MVVDLIVLACFAASAVLTQAMRRLGVSHGLLDVPNERSSHTRPTPRGGGVAIVATCAAGFALLAALQRIDAALFAALSGGLVVAGVGFLDDRRPLPAFIRLAAQAAVAAWAVAWFGGLPALRVGAHVVSFGWLGYVFATLGMIWAVNLFNFMDGIDGIAASEAIFVALAGAAVTLARGGSTGVALAAVVFAAACGGFLPWNWPPARIFLGDVGSGYLGYVIVVLAVAATRDDPAALWVWLILGGAFFTDATVTLVRRALRHERVHQAHRSHAYQWLARRWDSHTKVTLSVAAINLVWLLPCAVLATLRPEYSLFCAITALGVLAVLAIAVGSGRPEVRTAAQ
jgi:Fuc2NAc and GlcNAc transferase